jgi:hypothetical protein
LNGLIPLKFHDRVIINCGLFTEYGARPDHWIFVGVQITAPSKVTRKPEDENSEKQNCYTYVHFRKSTTFFLTAVCAACCVW